MSQKTNPTSLRLITNNKTFQSSWFSDQFYKEIFMYENRIHTYLQQFVKITASSKLTPIICVQNHYRKCVVLCIVHDARGTRREKEFLFKISRPNLLYSAYSVNFKNEQFATKLQSDFKRDPKIASIASSFAVKKINKSDVRTIIKPRNKGITVTGFVCKKFLDSSILRQFSFKNVRIKLNLERILNILNDFNVSTQDYANLDQNRKSLANNKHNAIHFLLQFLFEKKNKNFRFNSGMIDPLKNISLKKSCCNFAPVRVLYDSQNVWYVIDQIINLLQKRISFRQIKKIMLQLASHTFVKGVRLSCSGRVSGNSKKAQKAKVETYNCGVIGLNVFSSRVQFANKSASTSFGKIGVKIWIAFK